MERIPRAFPDQQEGEWEQRLAWGKASGTGFHRVALTSTRILFGYGQVVLYVHLEFSDKGQIRDINLKTVSA